MIHPVEPVVVGKVWSRVLPYVERSIAKGILPIEPDAIREAVESGRFKMFLLHSGKKLQGVSILNIRDELGVKYLNVYLMSHDKEYDNQAIDQVLLEEFGRTLGIKYMTYFGRPGFQKIHKKFGWKPAQVLMVKEI